MAGSAGSIFVDLLLRDASYVRGLNRASANTVKFSKTSSVALRAVGAAFATIGSTVAVRNIVAISDSFNSLESRLKLVSGSAEGAAFNLERIFESAQSNYQPLEESAAGFIRLAQSLNEYQKAQFDLTEISDLLSKTLRISGADAQAAAIFYRQFGQAASSDFKAIGQELQTFADQNPVFYQIIRKEAEKTGQTLKQFAADGGLSLELIAKALLENADNIRSQSASIEGTVGQTITKLSNEWKKYISESADVDLLTKGLKATFEGLAGAIRFANENNLTFTDTINRLRLRMIELDFTINSAKLSLLEFFKAPEEDIEQTRKNLDELLDKYNGIKQSFDRGLQVKVPVGQAASGASVSPNQQLSKSLQDIDTQYKELSKSAQQTNVDIEQFGKRAAENIQDAFADFLFDPFADGLDGMLKGFVDTMRRMIAEAQAAKLAKAIFGDFAGGEGEGLLGGIFKGASGGIGDFFAGFFADGGFVPPGQFGITGEEGAEIVMGGRSGATVIPQNKLGLGGNTYQIDARGADQGAVRRIEQALFALAGPGVIEQRVSNAQVRGAL